MVNGRVKEDEMGQDPATIMINFAERLSDHCLASTRVQPTNCERCRVGLVVLSPKKKITISDRAV